MCIRKQCMDKHALQGSQLDTVVDADNRLGVGGGDRRYFGTVGHRQPNDVGKVVFTLGIVIADAVEPAAQVGGGGAQDPGVTFQHLPLLGARVLMLDDAHHPSSRVTQDAPVAAGVVQFHGEQRQGLGSDQSDQGVQGFGADQRYVPEQHQHPVGTGQCRHRLHHRMPGAALLGLLDPDQGLTG